MNPYTIAINVIGFQAGWFACVLSAASNKPVIGFIIALLIIAMHIYCAKNRTTTIAILAFVTLFGSLWDSLLSSQNILVFNSGMITDYLAPYWIIIMWALFSTTLNVSLRWLYGHYWYAFIIGAISGPLVYMGGAALGAVNIPDTLTASIFLAIGWSMMLPVMIKFAEVLETESKIRVVIK